MLQSFVIALREGVEAALVIAIAVAYLRKTGRDNLLSSVYKALGAAVFASFLVAAVLSRLEHQRRPLRGPAFADKRRFCAQYGALDEPPCPAVISRD